MTTDTPAPASPAATEMAPCPWCECLDTDIWFGPRGARFVHCNLCGADGPAEAFERAAVEAWNHRATSDLAALRAERDRLRDALEFYRDHWRSDATGDIQEAHLTMTWQEPDEELFADAGRKAAEALDPPSRAALAEGRADG